MKRIQQIAKELNVGVSTITDYCSKLGQELDSPNKKVDQELESQIRALHEGKIDLSEINKPSKFEVFSTQELPSDFNLENPFSLEQQEIISDTDRFSNREERFLKIEDSELKTIFSDFEAYSICLGIDHRRANYIAREFFKNKQQTENEIYDAHTIAMSALHKYGNKTLSFIISLPPLPFKAVNATQIFSELDKRREKLEFPILRITFKKYPPHQPHIDSLKVSS